jgi:cytochrome c
MTLRPLTALRAAALAATPLLLAPAAALAGDPAAGEAEFRQCRSCHMIVSPAGETIQRGGRVGPNLYGIAGRTAGTVDGFRYSPALVAAGQAGLVWTEANFVGYITDPTGFLRRHTGDASVRSPMNFQATSGATDLFAYLESLQ